MNENRERLITSRQKITITGEKRIAYAFREIPHLVGIPAEYLTGLDQQYGLPPTIFLWGAKLYTGRQVSLIRDLMHNSISQDFFKAHWQDPDQEGDLW
jgi:hypothetical protein